MHSSHAALTEYMTVLQKQGCSLAMADGAFAVRAWFVITEVVGLVQASPSQALSRVS